MIQRLILILAILAIATVSSAGVWDSTYEGAAGTHGPITNSTARSAIDDHIRDQRQNVRYRMEVEHHVGDGDGTSYDNGLHRLGSARCYMSATPPDELNDSHTTPATVTDYLNTGVSGAGVTGLEDSASNSAAGAEDDVGHGRCWIDTDDYQMYIFVGEAGDNTPATVANGWYPVSQRFSGNLVLHGSFDATGGDGDSSASIPPYGWTDRFTGFTGTHFYGTSPTSEGDGFIYKHTTGAGSTDSGVSQLINGLKASTWYKFSVRALALAGDTCQLRVENAGATIPSTGEAETVSVSSFETLNVWAQTDASASDLTMILQGPDAGDLCSWDHASVTDRSPSAAPTGTIVYLDEEDGVTTTCTTAAYAGDACENLLTVTVTPPGPGYILDILAKFSVAYTSSDVCTFQLDNGSEQDVSQITGGVSGGGGEQTMYLTYTSNTLQSGAPLTISVNGHRGAGLDVCTAQGHKVLRAMLIPSGR